MPHYLFTVTEQLSRSILIEAASQDEAYEKGRAMWGNDEITLDSTDFDGVNFEIEDYPEPEDCLKFDFELNR